jgi:hypothetical protein
MNIKIKKKTDDELDLEAFKRDTVLFDYLDRVEKGLLTPEEKKQRQEFNDSIGIKKGN